MVKSPLKAYFCILLSRAAAEPKDSTANFILTRSAEAAKHTGEWDSSGPPQQAKSCFQFVLSRRFPRGDARRKVVAPARMPQAIF
ncbi:hypothetical protein [Faecalispora sporosphaeroides]|uniref:hypothetical protein n=1 Tax=Faecalispora sporosphaeroides TaxID=1549 RepID=UPI00036F417F|nr:hypothetical protein [Faecalispora sporosphaeroides]